MLEEWAALNIKCWILVFGNVPWIKQVFTSGIHVTKGAVKTTTFTVDVPAHLPPMWASTKRRSGQSLDYYHGGRRLISRITYKFYAVCLRRSKENVRICGETMHDNCHTYEDLLWKWRRNVQIIFTRLQSISLHYRDEVLTYFLPELRIFEVLKWKMFLELGLISFKPRNLSIVRSTQ